jgi:hypothetical protein
MAQSRSGPSACHRLGTSQSNGTAPVAKQNQKGRAHQLVSLLEERRPLKACNPPARRMHLHLAQGILQLHEEAARGFSVPGLGSLALWQQLA